MLAEPEQSAPRQVLSHVDASLADVLPSNYAMPDEKLGQIAARVPSDGPPELSPGAEAAVAEAGSFPRTDEGLIGTHALFGGLLLLASSGRVSMAFRELFSRMGLSAVPDEYIRLVREGVSEGFRQRLAERHPFNERPVEIPAYKADVAAVGEDLIDIRAEVDAFAYLLASRSLAPPLAVGLFGDWGSGKSFFMRSVRDRIAQLVGDPLVKDTPQKDLPYWKGVVQIEFNAWHYVGGDLWASLVERVFTGLGGDDGDAASSLAEEKAGWLRQIEQKRLQLTDIAATKTMKEEARAKAQEDLAAARARKADEERRLEQAQRDAISDVPLSASKTKVKAALAEIADAATDGTATQALTAIADARGQLSRASSTLRSYPLTGWRVVVGLAALFAVPLLVLLLGQIEAIPSVAQVFAGVSAALGVVAAGLRSVSLWSKQRIDELDEAEAEVRADIDDQRRALEEAVRDAADGVAAVTDEIDGLASQDRDLKNEIATLQARERSVTSGQMLSDFVTERLGSGDYRELLGIASLIQRDFGDLSRLIEANNHALLSQSAGEPSPGSSLNRIVLYIDDLDRCEPERVIEVLQAVHLLLAFPLFVVVVAVDSRWLAHSLAEHYPVLAPTPSTASGADRARPADYLEKIFQVPFWVESLGEGARRSLVRGLLQGNLIPTTLPGLPPENAEPLTYSDASKAMVDAMFRPPPRVNMNAASLGVTAIELAYLDGLAPLLGDTPRSVKRFVNVYQLLCALPTPDGGDPWVYRESVGFLLALTDGLPALADALHRLLDGPRSDPGGSIAEAVTSLRARVPEDELARYETWAPKHAAFLQRPAAFLVQPARRVRRFSFRF